MHTWYPVHACRCLQKYRRALVVLPYISVVAERTAHLAAVLAPVGIFVRGYCGDADTNAPLGLKCAVFLPSFTASGDQERV